MKDGHLSPQTLYAYQDQTLSAAERQAAERHLAACAHCRARLAGSSAVASALKAQFGHTEAPRSLQAAVRTRLRAEQPQPRFALLRFPRLLGAVALAVSFLFITVAAFVILHRADGNQSFLAQLADAHVRLARDPSGGQLQGDAAVLSTQFGQALHQPLAVPAPPGLQLVGGRVDMISGTAVAHLLYREDDATAMSVLVWQGATPLAGLTSRDYEGGRFYYGRVGGESVVLWPLGELNYACVSTDDPQDLLDTAQRVWRELAAQIPAALPALRGA